MKKTPWKAYAFWIIVAEAVGALSGWLTRTGVKDYEANVIQAPLSPPAVVFPIVWSTLFVLMGIGAARIYLTPTSKERSSSLRIFLLQLGFNFFWSIIFFNLQSFGFALLWLLILWLLILWMIFSFRKTDLPAAWLQVPYLLWVTFAAYLNFMVWRLNP